MPRPAPRRGYRAIDMTDRDPGNGPPRALYGRLEQMRRAIAPESSLPLGGLLASTFGAGLAVGVLGLIGSLADAPLLIAPLGASALLVFTVPENPMAQPRNVLLGNLIAVTLGVALSHALGSGWGAAALATALAVLLMQVQRALHAPAGATAVLASFQPHDWSYIGLPVMSGAAAVVIVALVFNNAIPGRRYPRHWFKPREQGEKS